MIRIQTILHSISTAPDYYYNLFFCPVKRDVTILAYSSLTIGFSWLLFDVATLFHWFSTTWVMVAKVISALTLFMNFIMVFLTLAKRVRDWNIKEPIEGQKEFEKRNPKKK